MTVLLVPWRAFETVSLLPETEVWASGRNDFGQLGDGSVAHKTAPVEACIVFGL